MNEARQRDVWFVDLSPVIGREQAGRRPAVVVSADAFGTGPSGLCIVAPITRTERPNPLHVAIEPPEGGLRETSYAMADMVRSVSRERLHERWGTVRPGTLEEIRVRIAALLRTR